MAKEAALAMRRRSFRPGNSRMYSTVVRGDSAGGCGSLTS